MTIRERFAETVKSKGGAVEVAQLLGCTRSYVDMIIAGRRSPGMRVAYAIEMRFGLPMRCWVEDAQAERSAPGGEP